MISYMKISHQKGFHELSKDPVIMVDVEKTYCENSAYVNIIPYNEVLNMYVKRTITIPEELMKDVERYLIGKHYSSLSEVIRDGIRRVLGEYKDRTNIDEVAQLYRDGRITIREAADILGITLREALEEFGRRGIYLHYSVEDLKDDIDGSDK